MAAHLRFDASTGRVEFRSPHGKHTEELLQLNDPATVQYRLGALRTVRVFNKEIDEQTKLLAAVEKLHKEGKLSLSERDIEVNEIQNEIDLLVRTLQSHTGELPTKLPRQQKLGVKLTAP
jgi:hypothetical protein